MNREEMQSMASELEQGQQQPSQQQQQQEKNQQEGEEVQNGKSEEESVAENTIKTIVKTPTGAEIIMRMAPTDTLFEVRQLLYECVETCYITSFDLTLDGGKTFLLDHKEIGDCEDFKPESVLEMIPTLYDERNSRRHFERVRELLFAELNKLYLSMAFVHKLPKSTQHSFPSFAGDIQGDPFVDLDLALSCDGELNGEGEIPSKQKNSSKRKKKKQGRGRQRGGEAVNSKHDNRYLFDSDSRGSFSMEGMTKILKSKKQQLLSCINKLEFASWNPPPGNRRLRGDLFYIKAKTLEEKTFYITASTSGFFINSSTKHRFNPEPSPKYRESNTLIGLLFNVSPLFGQAFRELIVLRTRKHPFEVTPVPFPNNSWLDVKEQHTYDSYRAEETITGPFGFESRGDTRDWNEEYQSCKELPSETVEERIVRDRTLFKIYGDFVDTATKGAQAIVHKSLRPMNAMDPEPSHIFVYQNIFFSYASDKDAEEIEREKALNTLHQIEDIAPDKDMFSIANNDLKGLKALNEADVRGIHTLATALVDYRGHRIVAQSIIPGILHGEQGSTHAYGSIDHGKTVKSDSEFHELAKEIGKKLRIKEHKVKDSEGNEFDLSSPLETKGIIGSDGRKYILDLIRITPRDLNFPDNTTAILRPEFVKDFLTRKVAEGVVELRSEEMKKKGRESKKSKQEEGSEEQKEENTPEEEKEAKEEKGSEKEKEENTQDTSIQSKDVEKYISQMDTISFNPNIGADVSLGGFKGELEKDEKILKEAAEHLLERSIPSLIKSVKMLEALPMDGTSLTEVFHERGINMRYLGKVASQAESVPFFKLLCEQEMVVRAAKRYFNSLMRKVSEHNILKLIERFLNSFFGDLKPSSDDITPKLSTKIVHQHIIELVKSKFDYTLSKDYIKNMNKRSTLRSFCLRVGICISSRDYEFTHHRPFSSDDILDMKPIVKHAAPMSSTAMRHFETGKANLASSQLEGAYHFLYEALVLLQQIHGPMNRQSATCYSNLASLLSNVADVKQAILHQHKALLISRRVMGEDHPLTAQFYQLMGMHAHSVNQTELALRYFLRAKYIAELVFGTDHPEYAIYLANIATMFQDMGDTQRSVKYLNKALKINQNVLGDDHFQTSSTYHSLAVTHSVRDDFKKAVDFERKSANILRRIFGNDDPRTQDAQKWLSYFTTRAVESRKEAKPLEDTAQALLRNMPKQFQTAFKSMYNSGLENVDLEKMTELVEQSRQRQNTESMKKSTHTTGKPQE